MKKGRPKGSLNKQKQYILPEGVTFLESALPERFHTETRLVFIDSKYGEFESTIKNIKRANGSTHPNAVQERRELTNTEIYGGPNPHCSPTVVKKAKQTMKNLYGVEHALSNPIFLQKSKDTAFENYGVDNGFKSPIVQEKRLKRMEETNNYNIPSSKGEKELRLYIQSLGFSSAGPGFFGGDTPRTVDIKIKEKNIAIEYNGEYFHNVEKLKNNKNYHLNKTKLANEHGYTLIHIFELEWKNRKDQIKSFLRSKLGKNTNKIYARKCELKEVNKKEADIFLNTYHILGTCKFIKAIGLYYNNELVSMITIGKHHRNNKDIVLSRFIGKNNVTVVGGLSKLCKFAYNEFGEFITWIDLRWSEGKSWIKNGWIQEEKLYPDYFYYNLKKRCIINKQKRKKSLVNTPNNMTEAEHAKQDGLVRVYDCGKLRLRFKG